jgi:hypothetical protein
MNQKIDSKMKFSITVKIKPLNKDARHKDAPTFLSLERGEIFSVKYLP